jgi:DNA-binding response OmpR family regulator
MLPSRAFNAPRPLRAEPDTTASEVQASLLAAIAPDDLTEFPTRPWRRLVPHDTADAIGVIERRRPRVVVVDWDYVGFDARRIAAAAVRVPGTALLVILGSPERAPAALKAGCHGVLLKPLTPNLIAARLGRLSRETQTATALGILAGKAGFFGTNRRWPEIACPTCQQEGAVSFDYASHRRNWFACMACEAVWMDRRRE